MVWGQTACQAQKKLRLLSIINSGSRKVTLYDTYWPAGRVGRCYPQRTVSPIIKRSRRPARNRGKRRWNPKDSWLPHDFRLVFLHRAAGSWKADAQAPRVPFSSEALSKDWVRLTKDIYQNSLRGNPQLGQCNQRGGPRALLDPALTHHRKAQEGQDGRRKKEAIKWTYPPSYPPVSQHKFKFKASKITFLKANQVKDISQDTALLGRNWG